MKHNQTNIASISLSVTAYAIFLAQMAIGGGNYQTSLAITTGFSVILTIILLNKKSQVYSAAQSNCVLPLSIITLFIIEACLANLHIDGLKLPSSPWSMVGISESISVDNSRSLIELIKFCGLINTFLVGVLIGLKKENVSLILRMISKFSILYAITSIFTFALLPQTTMGIFAKTLFPDRLTASFLSANTAGTFFATCTLIAIENFTFSLRLRRPVMNGSLERTIMSLVIPTLAITSNIIALLLTASRGAIFSLAGALVIRTFIDVLINRRSLRIMAAYLSAIVALALTAVIFFGRGHFIERLSTLSKDAEIRRNIYAYHINVISVRPWKVSGLAPSTL